MRAHCLQHVPFEGLGFIADWLAARNAEVTVTRLFAGETLPRPGGTDLLIILGGPMSVNDEAVHPWFRPEKEHVRASIAAGVPVLGICLGAQLMANCLGARVYRNADPEIGWHPVTAATARPGVFPFPPSIRAFHWHGETFDLPPGAVHLARSAACEHQAFQVGRRAIGLQFHLETTAESARALVANCADEIQPAAFVQPAEMLLGASAADYSAIHATAVDLLNYLTTPA
jgi:GMP synthase-like glutamine amidotransferase